MLHTGYLSTVRQVVWLNGGMTALYCMQLDTSSSCCCLCWQQQLSFSLVVALPPEADTHMHMNTHRLLRLCRWSSANLTGGTPTVPWMVTNTSNWFSGFCNGGELCAAW
jgi:hypothetical protein